MLIYSSHESHTSYICDKLGKSNDAPVGHLVAVMKRIMTHLQAQMAQRGGARTLSTQQCRAGDFDCPKPLEIAKHGVSSANVFSVENLLTLLGGWIAPFPNC